MSGDLAGKVAIVTGGANGIGRATVETFVAEGASVVVADVDEAGGQALAGQFGRSAAFKRTDVSSADDIQAVVDFAIAQFGGLHVMVNNAGVGGKPFANFLDDELQDFDRLLGVNLLGVMLGTQRAARHMAAHGGGAIVNLSSIAGVQAGLGVTTYRAAKAAVIHFSKSVAIDLAQHAIRVNCIAPGHIRTDLNAFAAPGISQELFDRLQAELAPVWDPSKPLKRRGSTHDVAQAILYFASDRSAQVTGTMLPVDGGIVAGDPVNHLAAILATRSRVLGV